MSPSTIDPVAPGTSSFATGRVAPLSPAVEAHAGSAVSWGAIFAGAAAAAALSLLLLVMGVGLGFTAMSPWAGSGASAGAIGGGSIVWLALTAVFASGIGGYLAGRLRTRWAATPVDEIHFRDTAHGLVAWSVATLVTAAVMTSAIGSIVGRGAEAGASLAGSAATAAAGAAAAGGAAVAGRASGGDNGLGYFTDSLFRRDATAAAPGGPAPDASASGAPPSGEVTRIFVQDLRAGTLSPDDTRYLGQLVAQRTGLAQPDAEKRVNDTFAAAKAAADDAAAKAREAADHARRGAAYASLWLVLSMLLGAFTASLMATYGGRHRDR